MTPTELTAARESLHLSQVELSRILGIHPTILNRWERDRTKIPTYLALAIYGLGQQQENERLKAAITELGEHDCQVCRETWCEEYQALLDRARNFDWLNQTL